MAEQSGGGARAAAGASTLRVLIAPDCFGESLTAVQAAAAISTGWHRSRPHDRLMIAPQSDGGPGFVSVLAELLGGVQGSQVSGPLETSVEAEWVFDAASKTAYLECAQACGLALLGGPPTPQTALAAHSAGVGQLIDAALSAGAHRIVVGLGGSASTDGGRGMVDALGGLAAGRERLADVELVAACDVEYPLLGPWGAARVFGPQKGADPATVAVLESRLSAWGTDLDAAAGWQVSAASGGGAAGGIGAALLALGGVVESGADIVARHTDLAAALAEADLLVTGEGRFDEQSLHGKVIGSLAAAARRRERELPVLVLAGQIGLDEPALRSAGIAVARAIADHAGSVGLALVDAANQLIGLATVTSSQIGIRPADSPQPADP
ncbi:glycerate kinase family protein [[Mycobacterium] nativiensis]|uniref:Glycerate kinase n=1 Tax=[Mycobacterium] nativiensis TaxID=2855503 RepID=A0ABU5Y4I3_9MYCO|nr:glycerate kinase [Mycolicibacter sp. MYC340]MEB3034596.1 glycerate kinase [Mycolicibacter sp. MYC340]